MIHCPLAFFYAEPLQHSPCWREPNGGGPLMIPPPPSHPLLRKVIARMRCQKLEPAILAFARQKVLSNA
jgi:hypothetical protein